MACAVGFSLWKMRTVVSRSVTELAEAVAHEWNADVTTGKVSLALFPPAVEVHDVRVTTSMEGGEETEIFTAPRVRVTPKLMPIFVGQVLIREAIAIDPTLLVRRQLRNGHISYRLPIENGAELGRPKFPVSVRGGTIRIEDRAVAPTRSYELTGVDLVLEPPSQEGAWPFELTVRAFGEASSVDASGTVAPGAGPTGGTRLDVEFKVREAEPEKLMKLFRLIEGAPLVGELDVEGAVHGFYGESGDENAPAAPLELEIHGSTGLVFADVADKLDFEITAQLDDKQLRINEGSARWGDVPFDVTGYIGAAVSRKLALRLIAENADVAETLAAIGVPERWRARARLDGTLRVMGTMHEPLLRYDAKAATVEFDGLALLPVRSKDLSCVGSVLAINADVSASCRAAEMKIASAVFPSSNFGITYWRDQIRFVQRELSVWGGKGDLMVGYSPETDNAEGGGFLDDMDAAEVVRNLIPATGLRIEARLDSLFQLGYDARGPWTLGRIGLHRGRVGGLGLGRDTVAAILEARGKAALAVEDLAVGHAKTLLKDSLEFSRLVFDFESREEGIALRSLSIAMEDADFRGEGVIGFDESVALWGNVILGTKLTEDLVASASAVAPLVAADGRLRVPVKIQGTTKDLDATVDERFLEALAVAARGKDVGPFVPMDPDARIVTELPSLEEHFYR
jgi:hypothetical protein